MAPAKTVCKNSEKFSYTGKEMSPMGLGFCADAETVGTQMTGRDGKSWIVGVKNNDKIWMRAPEKPLAPEEPVITNEQPAEPEPKAEAEPKTPKKPSKKTKKNTETEPEPKTPDQPIQPTEEPKTPEKPKRKYTKKSKTTPTEESSQPQTEKKERKKRGPSGYNLYIGKIMNELRTKTTGLKTTEYMQQAQAMWKALSKEEQTKIGEEMKAAHLAAQQEA